MSDVVSSEYFDLMNDGNNGVLLTTDFDLLWSSLPERARRETKNLGQALWSRMREKSAVGVFLTHINGPEESRVPVVWVDRNVSVGKGKVYWGLVDRPGNEGKITHDCEVFDLPSLTPVFKREDGLAKKRVNEVKRAEVAGPSQASNFGGADVLAVDGKRRGNAGRPTQARRGNSRVSQHQVA